MLARLVALWRKDDWRALIAGIAYVVLYALVSQMAWQGRLRAARYQGRRLRHGTSQSAATPAVRALVTLAASVGYPFAMVLLGVFSPGDIGLAWGRLGTVLLPLLAATAGWALWLALLWGRDARAGTSLRRPGAARLRPDTIVDAMIGEAHLATCRAALMPLLGSYWGMWLGVVLAMLAARTNPLMQWRMSSPAGRRRAYLDRALDWLSTAILALTGTIWAALLVRVLCRAALHLTVLPEPADPAPGSAERRAEEGPEAATRVRDAIAIQ